MPICFFLEGTKTTRGMIALLMTTTHCSRFGVNKKGGVDEMSCKIFYHKLANKIAKTHDDKDDEAEVIVAGIKKK